jgi:hypothetical protein
MRGESMQWGGMLFYISRKKKNTEELKKNESERLWQMQTIEGISDDGRREKKSNIISDSYFT